jgi:type IV secretion system protein VirD4
MFDSPQVWLLFLVPLVVVAVVAVIAGLVTGGRGELRRQERERTLSGAWATPKDIPELIVDGPVPTRVLLGKMGKHLVANPPRRSVLVMAPTGAGKTPRFVVPTVLRHKGPALIASVKSDVHALTLKEREKAGPVWVFDPAGSTGQTSCRWSPLASIRTYGDALKAAAWLTESSKVDGRGLEDQKFWDSLGRKLLAPMLFAAASKDRHIADVVRWVDYMAEEEVAELLDEIGDNDAITAWQASRNRPEKTKGSVYGTAEVVLEAFGHPDVRDALTVDPDSEDMFDHRALLDGGTLYLVAPESDQALFAPVLETLVNAVLREVEIRAATTALPLDPPLLNMLDEAANIAPLRRLDKVASKGANEGVITVTVWQDEGQLVRIYGREAARTVKSNHTAHVYLPGISDDATLKALSEAIGDHKVNRKSVSRNHNGEQGTSSGYQDEVLAPPSWLRRMPGGTALVLTGPHKPMRLTLPGWFEEPELRAMVDPDVAAAFDERFSTTRIAK